MPKTVHVLPINDIQDHKEVGDDCLCSPEIEPVFDNDGACGWLISHHSFDARGKI